MLNLQVCVMLMIQPSKFNNNKKKEINYINLLSLYHTSHVCFVCVLRFYLCINVNSFVPIITVDFRNQYLECKKNTGLKLRKQTKQKSRNYSIKYHLDISLMVFYVYFSFFHQKNLLPGRNILSLFGLKIYFAIKYKTKQKNSRLFPTIWISP